jgi:capsular polysaccharide biosynthesis protein
VELNEAGRRIIGQHWELIVCLMLLGLCAGAALHLGDKPEYTASTRLVLGTADPKTSSESAGISDTAWALGTAPSKVSAAMTKARVTGRRAEDIAKRVAVKAVGASGVLELSVTDRNPRVATALANAIAQQIRQARLDAGDLELRGLLAGIDRRITAINKKVLELDQRVVTNPRVRSVGESLSQQRAVLETQRTSALLDASKQPRPLIVSAATVPVEANASGRWPAIILGGILGLLLGAGLAAIFETLRPTLVGGEAVARELDAPLLGTLSGRSAAANADAPAVAGRLRLASKAAGVHNIGLLPLRRGVDLPHLAEQLGGTGEDGAGHASRGRIGLFDVSSTTLVNGGGTGLVVVAPDAPKKAELEEIRNLLRLTPGPLLGVVTYNRGSARRSRPADDHPNRPAKRKRRADSEETQA